mmetsp:Transcript_26061/g.30067  ORF Transcript_26061/g.30067 Transcript_26061/m.30067 type:complete len:96 (-) Transcript_26061:90-377(-)
MYVYTLNFQVSNGINGGTLWMSCFRNQGEVILGGLTAESYHIIVKENSDCPQDLLNIGSEHAYKRYRFYVQCLQDSYGFSERTRYICRTVTEEKF